MRPIPHVEREIGFFLACGVHDMYKAACRIPPSTTKCSKCTRSGSSTIKRHSMQRDDLTICEPDRLGYLRSA